MIRSCSAGSIFLRTSVFLSFSDSPPAAVSPTEARIRERSALSSFFSCCIRATAFLFFRKGSLSAAAAVSSDAEFCPRLSSPRPGGPERTVFCRLSGSRSISAVFQQVQKACFQIRTAVTDIRKSIDQSRHCRSDPHGP